ncbi:MAG: glycosyltransferase family 4 protein [Candidatus Omnitrophota bacterium]
MKILNIIQRYPPSIGGSEIWCQRICRYFAKLGHKVTVLTLDVYKEEEYWFDPPIYNHIIEFGKIEYDEGVKVIRCRRNKIHPLLFRLFEAINKSFKIYLYGPHSIELFFRIIREVMRVDVVHLHTIPYPHNILGFFIAKLFRKKVVITPHFHIGHVLYETKANFYLMRRCDAVFAVNDYERKHLIQKIDPKKVHVAYNTVDPSEYKTKDIDVFKKEVFDKYGISSEHKIIIFLGRKIEYKKVDTLVEAVRALKKDIKVKLFLVGPNFPWYEGYCVHLPEEDKRDIIDFGIVTNQEKAKLLRVSDVLVLPSKFEAFGIVFLEAWASGLPVIGVDTPTVAKVIDKGGLLFNYGDSNDLRDKLFDVLSNGLGKKLADKGKEQLENNYIIDKVGSKMLGVYEEVL